MEIKFKNAVTETDSLSLGELQDLSDKIQHEIDIMVHDVEQAKLTKKTTGVSADPGWLYRINYAVKLCRRNNQSLMRVISERKKIERAKENERRMIVSQQKRNDRQKDGRQFERAFVNIAKEMLPPHVFQSIMVEVWRQLDDTSLSYDEA